MYESCINGFKSITQNSLPVETTLCCNVVYCDYSICLYTCISSMFCSEVAAVCEVEEVVQGHISTMANAQERDRLTEELKEIMNSNLLYVTHLLRTKHQGDYHKFVLNNLQPGEAVVIIDYKMKLELGVHLREIQ